MLLMLPYLHTTDFLLHFLTSVGFEEHLMAVFDVNLE
jgi:hypothetical protein